MQSNEFNNNSAHAVSLRYAIVGYGVEGKAMASYLLEHGFSDVTVCDRDVHLDLMEGVSARLGEDYLDGLNDFDLIFRSPGIKLRDLIQTGVAREKVTSVTKYFFEKCPCPIIGVTGTKGKGTTSTLIYEMLRAAGRDAYLGGNIGRPPVEFLDDLRSSSIVVLELSSFQLQDLDCSPQTAVVLNITSEHMDYHQSFEEYVDAKLNILKYQKPEDFLISSHDYPQAKSKKIFFDPHIKNPKGAIIFDGEKIISKSEIGLIGEHNLENIFPAIAAARCYDVPVQKIAQVLKNFKGLPHRLEFVGEKNGVKFYDDSASTAPEPSMAGMLAFSNPVYLIAGGSEKYVNFDEWGATVRATQRVQKVFLVGPTGERMAKLIDSKGELVANLQEGFDRAVALAQPGSVVLLSPGAASFNEFRNYKERGERFREMVYQISGKES